ncbi:hypothetical protein DM02DRAFT_689255 [Periconia macrospinosa]|uniref:SET domain-containing protein n=1 Tax=Periconia macrospinosa TaxID=97972 RepID=A0A2V1DFB7_9PLEO|nr:hypothetical protein DM02DRAFT_689255 [Periconia macrospinosa]
MNAQELVQQEFLERLKIYSDGLRVHKERKGERPTDRKSAEELECGFLERYLTHVDAARDKTLAFPVVVPIPYPPCITPVAELKNVTMRELRLETRHKGTRLLLKAITQSHRIGGIVAATQDTRGDAAAVVMYHQQPENVRRAVDILGKGSVILVKEPYFEVVGPGQYRIRVDHLSDVVFLEKNDPRVPKAWRSKALGSEKTADAYRLKGNEAVEQNKFWEAITAYSAGLSLKPTADETGALCRNRALAYLRTRQYDAALLDTCYPDFLPQPSYNGMIRAAEALYHLGRFDESAKVMQKLCSEFPNHEHAQGQLERVQARLSEQQTGVYDFRQLQIDATKLKPPTLDRATYIGPVEVRDAPGKGRGLFVTKAVKAGDLLLCEKAFGYVHAPEDKYARAPTIMVHMETDRAIMNEQVDLLQALIRKLYHNPSLIPTFTSLCHGGYEGQTTFEVDGAPAVDTFLVERIMTLNVFGYWRTTSLADHIDFVSPNTKREQDHSCGVWTTASYINHSCMNNVERAFIGDMMIVRATKDLDADTELGFWYKDPFRSNFAQRQADHEEWGFVCYCSLCEDARATETSTIDKRKELWLEAEELCGRIPPTPAYEIEQIAKALDDTYTQPASKVPRVELRDLLLVIARLYVISKEPSKVLEYVGKMLTSLGFIIHGADTSSTRFAVEQWGMVAEPFVEAFLHARKAFEVLGRPEDAEKAKEYAKLVFKMVIGEDDSFEAVHGDHDTRFGWVC